MRGLPVLCGLLAVIWATAWPALDRMAPAARMPASRAAPLALRARAAQGDGAGVAARQRSRLQRSAS